MEKIRTRFAPSPTGFLHIGGLRTALYSFALARHEKGEFILRIEDTDQKRKVKGAEESLKETLKKFGLIWDEYYIQSERAKLGIYQKAAKNLVETGDAFYCKCSPKNAKEEGYSKILRDPCRDKGFSDGAIKLRVPAGKTISYFDFVHKKEISWNSDLVYDATLLKSDGYPTYHLAVAVDDLEMKITHILRGHDWLPSTPIHLLVFEFIAGLQLGGASGSESKRPEIGHLTDILSGVTGKKLSKRRESVFVESFLKEGYLPEALLNFIMLLGWAPKDNREIYTLDEFVKDFSIDGFQEANPRFFREKLDWFNGEYIRKLSNDSLNSKFKIQNSKFAKYTKDKQLSITKIIKERINKISDLDILAGFFFEAPKAEKKLFGTNYREHLSKASGVFNNINSWKLDEINKGLTDLISKEGFNTGEFFMDLRIAVCGSKVTPPINESIVILGQKEILKRINNVIDH